MLGFNQEDEDDEYEQTYDNNDSVNNKSNSRTGLKQKGKKVAKDIGKKIAQVFREGIKKIFLTLMRHPVALAIVVGIIVFLAAVLYVYEKFGDEAMSTSVSTYFSSSALASSNPEAQALYEKSGSLVLAKSEDLKSVSDDFMEEMELKYQYVYEAMKEEGYIGSHKISDITYASGLNINSAYEFILNAEKLNFNRITWKQVDRDTGEKTDIEDFCTNSELGLKFPVYVEEGETKNCDDGVVSPDVTYFAELARPYLQTYLIPSTMAMGLSIINAEDKMGDFAFQIIDSGYHKITFERYKLKNVTRHKTISKYMNTSITIQLYSKNEYVPTSGGSYYVVAFDDTSGLYIPGQSFITSSDGLFYDADGTQNDRGSYILSGGTYVKVDGVSYSIETKYGYLLSDAENKYDEAKAEYENRKANGTLSEKSATLKAGYADRTEDKNIVYMLAKAETLRKYNEVAFNQKKYSEENVDNFRNPKTKTTVNTEDYVEGFDLSSYESITDLSGWSLYRTNTYNVELGQYITDKYYWTDEMETLGAINRNYTTDDVEAFYKEAQKQSGVGESSLSSMSSEDKSYYDALESDKDITRVDMVNAVPDMFLDYVADSEKYSDNIGISRAKLSQAFKNMNEYIEELLEGYEADIDPEAALNVANTIVSVNFNGLISQNFGWPLAQDGNEKITSCSGARLDPMGSGVVATHGALDISANQGHPIVASQDGTVYKMQDWTDSYGYMVVLKHGEDENYVYYTLYAHMLTYSGTNGLNLKVGDTVTAGQVIGYVGSTGNSTGNHLHFELIAWPKSDNNGNYYFNNYKYSLEPILYIQKSTLPDRIINQSSLPSNCGDITSDDFGSMAQASNYEARTMPSTHAEIDAIIDTMDDLEIISRIIMGEQGVGSTESQVLVGISILNRANGSSVKAVAKQKYIGASSGLEFYSYNCVAGSNFWGEISSSIVEAANLAIQAYNNQTYVVDGIECINVKGFKAGSESELQDTWNGWRKGIVLRNRSNYTGFYW